MGVDSLLRAALFQFLALIFCWVRWVLFWLVPPLHLVSHLRGLASGSRKPDRRGGFADSSCHSCGIGTEEKRRKWEKPNESKLAEVEWPEAVDLISSGGFLRILEDS